MDKFVEYAPWIVVIVIFLCQIKLFVRPEDLEKKHKIITEEVDTKIKSAGFTMPADLEKKHNEIVEEVDAKIKDAGFMTPADFEAKRADFAKYIADNYVSNQTYFYNHDDLKKETTSIKDTLYRIDDKIEKRNIEDRKMLLEVMNAIIKKAN